MMRAVLGEGRFVDPNIMYKHWEKGWWALEELERLGIPMRWFNGELRYCADSIRLRGNDVTLQVNWNNAKPKFAAAVREKGVNVLERTMVVDLLINNGKAVGVGGCTFLNGDDYLFFSHRGMGIAKALPKGVPAKVIVAEFYGRETGTCRSLSGHRTSYAELGVSGPSGSVASDLTMAAGAGIAAKQRGKGQVVAAFFGDGAMDRGTFHTSQLMSANWKLPVVWVCEDNGYFGPTSVKEHYPKENIADLAFGYGIPGIVVDGQDVVAVFEAVQTAVARARAGEGPSLIECKTLCFAEDIYTGPKNMEEARRTRDPITLFKKRLLEEGALTPENIKRINREAVAEMEEADRFATESPAPDPEILRQAIYAD